MGEKVVDRNRFKYLVDNIQCFFSFWMMMVMMNFVFPSEQGIF
jgi:hypothetical protein